MKKKYSPVFLVLSIIANAQSFTKTDSLKGSDTAYRNFWDVKKYELTVEPDFATKSVKGTNRIYFEISRNVDRPIFQIDLQQPMVFQMADKGFTARREGDFIFITSHRKFKKGEKGSFTIRYSGKPVIGKHLPWDGGWTFTKDENGNPWISVADESIGASSWFPLKDIWSDEPEEGVLMEIITPRELTGVGNGRLVAEKLVQGKKHWFWYVTNPINAYSIIPSVGKYVNFKDQYPGEKGNLDLDFWVLENNLDKAKAQFTQVKPMLKAFEHWFGPYPFYEDSYKLVETPYLGMEHQSNVGYGNRYKNGYMGRDWSGTGTGLKWDFIIIHESGHEWFANNITARDQADMWVHEAFTCYSETLYTEQTFGKADADLYITGIRKNIANDIPIIGTYGVRNEGSSDMYWKGAGMLHTIRQIISNDEKFRQILRGLNADFYHQTVTGKMVEDYISAKSGIDFSTVFEQYLRTVKIPVFEYQLTGNSLKYRYTNTVKNLKLPLRLKNSGLLLKPGSEWQTVMLDNNYIPQFDESYLVEYKPLPAK